MTQPQSAPPSASPSPSHEPAAGPARRWPMVLGGLVVAGFIVTVLAIIFVPRRDVSTDDAYVEAHNAVIAPRISGQITDVEVDDNQFVKQGQVLATVDDRDYRTALDDALATLARDQAEVVDASATVDRQPSLISEQAAQVQALQARTAFSSADAKRYAHLASTGAGTAQARQLAETRWKQDAADLAGARSALAAAQHQMDILKAKHQASIEAVSADQARVAQARLNLSYTQILAPVDGMVGARSVQVGNYVSPGTTLMAVVPMQKLYIEANYREVELKHVRPGQKVSIHLDAYNVDLNGVVDSVPPASGAAFAPIAPENATGNFTKIVQRLPVKILVDADQPLANLLRVGFSVETTIHTDFADVVGAQRNSAAAVKLGHE
ncbi:HlyD family secretion protein [Frateuria aurantia]